MNSEQLTEILKAAFPDAEVAVSGQAGKFDLRIVDDQFEPDIEQLRPALGSQRTPGRPDGLCRLDGAAGFNGAATRHFGQGQAGRRVHHRQRGLAVGGDPISGNKVG